MRNLKKYLAVIVAIAVMMTAMIPAFAEEATTTIPADAKICADLGVLKGSGDGVTVEYLAGSVDRMQAARLYLRLKGLEEEALATDEDAENFPDADETNADGRKIMAYLKAHPEHGFAGGVSGNFGPNDQMEAQPYYKVLLTALGYAQKDEAGVGDFDYADTLTFAASKGLSKVATVTDFTRADFATASVEALKATVKGGTKTLAAVLVDAGKIDKDAAIAAGLYVDVPEVVEVTSIYTDNLKQVKIEFNTAIDKATAESKDNYKIDNFTFDGAALSEDGKTVTLTLNDSETTKFTNQKEYKITITGLKDASGKAIAKVDKKAFIPVDTTIPTVTSVEALGTKAVKVVFSEPVKKSTATTMGNYKIDGKSIAGVIKYSFANSVIIQTTMAVGEHTMSIDGVADFHDYKANAKDIAFTVVEDTEAPLIESATAKDLMEVEVIFNEPVKSVSKAYHTSDSKTGTIKVDDKKVTVTFATDKRLPATDTTLTLKDVEDYSGNKATREVTVTPNLDTERPEVVSAKAEVVDGKHKFTIAFSEKVKEDDAKKGSNYTIQDKDGKAVSGKGLNKDGHPSSATYDSSKKEATFTLSSTLDAGTYTLEIVGISDISYIGNVMLPYSTTIEIGDTSNPSLVKAWIEQETISGSPTQYDAKLYVKYSEDMATEGTGSVLEYTKYTYSNSYPASPSWLPVPKDSEVSLSTSDTVVVTLPRSTTDYKGTVQGIRVSLVADKEDNFLTNYYDDIVLSPDKGTIAINSAKAIEKDTIEVEFDGILSNVEASDFTAAGKEVEQATDISKKDGKTTVQFKFKDGYEMSANANGGTAQFTVAVAAVDVGTQDSNGAKVSGFETIVDAIKPSPIDVAISGVDRPFKLVEETGSYFIYVYMDEEIAVNTNAADVMDVKYDGTKLKVVSVTAVAGVNPAIKIELGSELREDDNDVIAASKIIATNTFDVVVKTSNDDLKYIKDADGDGVAVDEVNKSEALANVVSADVETFVNGLKAAADLAPIAAEVSDLAAGITVITAPAVDATTLALPTVPAGYAVEIKTSDDSVVITTGGVIAPPLTATTVNLVLTVTHIASGATADTASIAVVVPQSNQGAVNDVAAGITTIDAPEVDATTLELPAVPDGYTVIIKTSDNAIITTDGDITPGVQTTVNLVLTVIHTASGSEADTVSIAVVVPAAS